VTALFAKLHLDSQINVRRGHMQQRIFVSQPMNLSGREKALGSLLTVEFTHAGYSNPTHNTGQLCPLSAAFCP
jgi:hypothetical protein